MGYHRSCNNDKLVGVTIEKHIIGCLANVNSSASCIGRRRNWFLSYYNRNSPGRPPPPLIGGTAFVFTLQTQVAQIVRVIPPLVTDFIIVSLHFYSAIYSQKTILTTSDDGRELSAMGIYLNGGLHV